MTIFSKRASTSPSRDFNWYVSISSLLTALEKKISCQHWLQFAKSKTKTDFSKNVPFPVPQISHIMSLPCQANRTGAEHVHATRRSYDALRSFKSRVPLPKNEHSLVLVVLWVSRDGLIPLNKIRANKFHHLGHPQPSGYQKDPAENKTTWSTFHKHSFNLKLFKLPAGVVSTLLISEDVAPFCCWLHGPNPPNIHPVLYLQPELLLKHRQVEGEFVRWRVKLTAHSLEKEVWSIAQQWVPVVPQVELSVASSCMDLVNAYEFSVPGVP